jgi:hypothetical protein
MRRAAIGQVAAVCAGIIGGLAMVALGQSSTQPATKPADLRTWLVDVPAKQVTVTVSYPAGWTTKKDAAGKATVSPPGAEDLQAPPRWTFDVKTDTQNHPIDELLALYVKAVQAKQGTVTESKLIDLPGGKKGAAVTYTMMAGDTSMTTRNTIVPLEKGQLLITDEFAVTSAWKDVEPTFARMSAAVTAGPLEK